MDSVDVEYERLYRANVRAVHAYCLRRTSIEEAKDATADVFVVAWRRFDDIPSGEAALPWLYAVARNVLRDRERSRRRRLRLAAKVAAHGQTAVEGPEPLVVRSSEHEQVVSALNALPETDREIIRLVEWEGLSREQVATAMYLSRSAVDKRISRAHKKLARLLGTEVPRVRTTPVQAEEGGEA